MSRVFITKKLSQEVSKRQTANSPNVVEDEFLVPSGKTLLVDRFMGGREDAETEVRCELIERDGGTDTIIAVGYALNFDMRDVGTFIGDGTKKIVLRLINGDNGALHMTGIWRGVYDG